VGPVPAVAAVRRAVRTEIADLAAGELVLAACSGGADSLALAAALAVEAPRRQLRAGLITVDHGLQPGSAEQAATVLEQARRLGLAPAECVPTGVTGAGGPEAAARRARYAALTTAATRLGAAAVLLGHTLDDQAETVLLGLARGAGARSLAGIPVRRGPFRRPLLGLPRAITVAACAADGLRAWRDPHNSDPRYARVRVRRQAMPVLERTLGPGVAAALARSARLLRADAEALDDIAAAAWAEIGTADGSLEVAALTELPAAIRTRVLRTAALTAGAPGGALSAAHVDALDALVTGWRGQGPVALPGGLGGVRRSGKLMIREPAGRE
jgi:tRNA(Ile)-lysidine synthase